MFIVVRCKSRMAMAFDTKKQSMRKIKSYVTRSGRITKRQRNALNQYTGAYIIPYEPKFIMFDQYFPKLQGLVIEIGFGMGDSLLSMVNSNKDLNYLGIEVHQPGVGNVLASIDQFGLDNLRIMQHDAVEVFDNCIQNNTLAGIQVFFPDPWHKKRHQKRRLLNKHFAGILAQKLNDKGFIHFATDCEDYANEVLYIFQKNSRLRNMYESFVSEPLLRPSTKFEKRGKLLRHDIWDIFFRKE